MDHPHRELILNYIDVLGFDKPIVSVFEVGCNAGPNLLKIQKTLPQIRLGGCDVNPDAIALAKEKLPDAELFEASASKLPVPDKSYDVVLIDAVCLYFNPRQIIIVLNEMQRVAKRGLILVEWKDKSTYGVVKDFHWARNYKRLLENMGYRVEETKLRESDWPSKNWSKHGYVYLAEAKG